MVSSCGVPPWQRWSSPSIRSRWLREKRSAEEVVPKKGGSVKKVSSGSTQSSAEAERRRAKERTYRKTMMNTQTTTKTNHYFRALVALAMLASLLVVLSARTSHASITFAVNQTSDASDENLADGVCDINSLVSGDQCTLRAAIEQANATSGADTINFNLLGSGPFTITPTS